MITTDLLRTLVPTLDRTQFAVLLKSVLGIRTPEQEANIDLKHQIQVGLWEFMWSLGFVSDAQARKILELTGEIITRVSQWYVTTPKNAHLPRITVTFADRRWVCWLQSKTWYDMLYDQTVDVLPEPAVMLITCDVTALYKRQLAWLDRHRSKDAEPQHHAGSDDTILQA